MTTREDLLDDLRAGTAMVRANGSTATVRQGVTLALSSVYRLRNALFPTPAGFARDASLSDEGRVTLGLVVLRGRLEHAALAGNDPRVLPLYPGPHLAPSEDLRPGSNLSWLPWERLSVDDRREMEERNRVGADCYKSHVGGLPVLQSLRQAERYFTDAQ